MPKQKKRPNKQMKKQTDGRQSLSDYYRQKAADRRRLAKARREFASAYENVIDVREQFSYKGNISSLNVKRKLSDAVALRTSRETMALQDEAVADMYEQLAKEYEGKKGYEASDDWTDPHAKTFEKYNTRDTPVGPLSARKQALVNNLKSIRGFKMAAAIYTGLGAAYFKMVDKIERRVMGLEEESKELAKDIELDTTKPTEETADVNPTETVVDPDASVYRQMIDADSKPPYVNLNRLRTTMSRFDKAVDMGDANVDKLRNSLESRMFVSVFELDRRDSHDAKIHMLEELDRLSKIKDFENPLADLPVVDSKTSYRGVVSDFGQAVIGFEFLAETYAKMGDAYSAKVIEFENARDAALASMQATEALAVDMTERELEDPHAEPDENLLLERAKGRLKRSSEETKYPRTVTMAIGRVDRMRSADEKKRKAAKPRVKYVKNQFKTERAMRGKRFTYEAPTASVTEVKNEVAHEVEAPKDEVKTTPKIDISVDTSQAEHDDAVANELKKHENLAKRQADEKKTTVPKPSNDEPEF